MKNLHYKRMAKNAAMLYIRMLLTMAVMLYTSRVVLQTLGVEDFGIYYVVAGFVMMLGFLHGAMSSATQRFLAFELGRSGTKNVSGIFSMSFNIHILISLLIFLIGESVGLWFVRNQMTIPVDRIYAAEWVFHLALLSFMITVISVPYNALIIAHERMSMFAWLSIVDVFLKLAVVFVLSWFDADKLILFAVLSLVVVFVVFMLGRAFCKSRFKEASLKFYWDGELFKTMISYTGWNLWGNIAAVMSSQGVNVLLNVFFGPSVNAARTISMQVTVALNKFVQNLQMAINPQIIKAYAAQDMDYMHRLVCYGAKYNFFLLFFLSIPVLGNTEALIGLWLGAAPEYTVIFVQLMVFNILIDCVSAPLMMSAQATGQVRLYQSVVGGVLLLNVPLSYLVLKLGGEPYTVIYSAMACSVIAFLARLFILRRLTNLPVQRFVKEVLGRGFLVGAGAVLLCWLVFNSMSTDVGLWLRMLAMAICVLVSVVTFGFDKIERKFICDKYKSLVSRDAH